MITARQFGRYPWSVLDDLFGWQEDFNRLLGARVEGNPPVNVWETREELTVDIALPGVEVKDVDISVTGNQLKVTGTRIIEPGVTDAAYLIRERAQGSFGRTLTLPYRVEAAKVKAIYRQGVLRIVLPKSEEDKPRRIAVEAEG